MTARAVRIGTLAAALVAVLAVRDGSAQTIGEARRVFAWGGVAGNIDYPKGYSNIQARSGGPLAVGVIFGGTVSDRWSVQVEGEWPTSDQTMVYRFPYRPGLQPDKSLYRTTSRTPTVAVLFGVHRRLPKHVDVAFQFGPCVLNERRTEEHQDLTNGTVTESDASSWNRWHPGWSVGGDVAVNVTSRVAVVGQLRVHMQGLWLQEFMPVWKVRVVRPAVGVRVRF